MTRKGRTRNDREGVKGEEIGACAHGSSDPFQPFDRLRANGEEFLEFIEFVEFIGSLVR